MIFGKISMGAEARREAAQSPPGARREAAPPPPGTAPDGGAGISPARPPSRPQRQPEAQQDGRRRTARTLTTAYTPPAPRAGPGAPRPSRESSTLTRYHPDPPGRDLFPPASQRGPPPEGGRPPARHAGAQGPANRASRKAPRLAARPPLRGGRARGRGLHPLAGAGYGPARPRYNHGPEKKWRYHHEH